MDNKPTYEELEKKVKRLEKEVYEHQLAKETLRESEGQFRIFFNCCPMGIFIYSVDHDGNLIFQNANQAADDILGVNCQNFVGKTIEEAFPPLAKTEVPTRYKETAVEGRIWETEQIDYAHGEIRGAYKVVAFQTKPNEMACIFEDITQRKLTEKALRESEEKYKSFIDNAPVGMYTINTKGEFTYGNNKLLEMTGYKTEDWLYKPFHPIVHPEDLDIVIEKVQNRINGHRPSDPYEIRIFTASGNIMWVQINSESIFEEDEKGEKILVGMQSFVQDITGKKLAEEALRESEMQIRLLLDSTAEAIYGLDTSGNCTFANPACLQLLGYTSTDDLIGKNMHDLIHHTRPDGSPYPIDECCIYQAFRRGEGSHVDDEFLWRADGTSFPVEYWSYPIYRNDKVVGSVVTFWDISERKASEKERTKLEAQLRQARKMESIGTLVGGIAHEFNNILGIILGNTELAMDDIPEWSSARLSLNEIRSASLRAKDVVQQLLSFSRKKEPERKPINLSPIIRESIMLLKASIPTSIEIRQNIQVIKDAIFADPTQIGQILINLCTNAVHAMPDGGILEVGLSNIEIDDDTALHSPELKSGHYAVLKVTDTGHGILQEHMDRIFDPYFTTKEVGEGSGIGLAVVHGIVKGHEGTVLVESEPQTGTTFQVFFPVTEEKAVPESNRVESLLTGCERILFVDDEPSIVNMAQQLLEKLGYHVETRMSPLEALDLFRLKPDKFDLVITDMTMPKMTGDKLVKEILKIRHDMPIILCTGFSEKIPEDKAKEFGINAFALKPIVISDFATTVRQVLNGK